ncbi:MAG: hypothetical protein NTY74_01810 [Ignavibacteriae bacterium]|nr:hypothetical protein [Ignavibacteriota bacterium]
MKQIKQFLLVVILFTVFANVGWGQTPLLNENFSYTVGTDLTANGWNLTGSTASPTVMVTASTISYAGYLSSGTGLETTLSNTGQDVNKTFTAQTSESIYASCLINVTSSQTTGDYFFHLGGATMSTTYHGRVFIKKDAITTNFAFGISRAGLIGTAIFTPYSYTTGTTYLLVLKYTVVAGTTNDISAIYINPTLNAAEPVTGWTISTDTPADLASIGSVGLRQGSSSAAPALKLDGIRVATTWADIVGPVIVAPTTQASGITFPSVGTSSMTVNWSSGNGSNRAVFVRESNQGSIVNPTNGVTYTASNDWMTKGTQLSTSGYYCIYNGSSNTVNLSNLNQNTTYWVQIFEYNGTGSTTTFYTATASNNPNSQTTLTASSPTISVGSISGFGNVPVNTTSVELNYTVLGANLTADIVLTPPSGFEISTNSGANFVANLGTITLTQTGGTVNSTTIYVRFKPTAITSYSGNITHTSTGANDPNVALSGTGVSPSDPISFTAVTESSSQINLTSTANTNGNNIVVIYNATGTFSTPTDGVAPGIQGEAFAGGTIWYKGTAASLTNHTSLSPFQTVYYKTFSYDAYNFYSAGLTANATTLKIAPTTQASAITFPTVANTSMTINWTSGNGDKRVVLMNTSNSFTDPVDGATITTSTTYSGSGEQCIYNSTSNTVSVTGLTAGTVYWFRVYEYNNTGLNSKFLLTTGTNNPNSQVTNTPASFFENFEAGTKGSYAVSSVVCTMGSWEMSDALIGNLTNDKKNNTWSVRMQTAGYIKMNFDLTNGARDITINSASYGTDATCTWQLQKSTDGGSTWSNVGALVSTTATLTPTTFSVNQPGAVRFKILKTTSSTKINIDDITITDYDKTVTTSSQLPLTEYGNLTINGSGINVTLAGNTTVNGTLTFTNGKLNLGANNLTLGSSATVSGVSASNYIVTNSTGVLTRNPAVNTEILFPIGTADAYSPVWITNSGSTGDYTINVEPDVSGTNSGADRLKLKWNVNGPASSNTKLRVGWLTSQEGTNFTANRNTYAQLWHLYNNSWVTAGTANLAAGIGEFVDFTLYASGITTYSPFGSGQNESAMPVTLSSLTNSVTGRNIKLNWTTTSEINNAGFNIERLGIRQQAIGKRLDT